MTTPSIVVLAMSFATALAAFDQIDLPTLPGPSIYDPMRYHGLSFTPDGSAWATGASGQVRIDSADALTLMNYGWGANDAVVGGDGTLWIAHDLGLRRRDPVTYALTQVNSQWIRDVEWDPAGVLWLVQYTFSEFETVHRFNPATGEDTSFFLGGRSWTALFANGALWVLVGNPNVRRFEVVRIAAPAGPMTRFAVSEAGALVPATDGRLWVVGRKMMTRLTPADGSVESFPSPIPQAWNDDSELRGLSFAPAGDGSVWIAHMGGLAQLEGERLTNYETPSLPPGGFFRPSYRPAAAFGPDGRLWFIDRYVICCTILPTIYLPAPPLAVIRRVDVASLGDGNAYQLSNADVPALSPLMVIAFVAILAAAGLLRLRS